MTLILAIDVGIKNMGFCCAHFDEQWNLVEILQIGRIDITIMTHRNINRRDCKIPHTNELSDRIDHFLQNYEELFDTMNLVLIERQPIMGLTSVEQLLYNHFKKTIPVKIISPKSMHIWMKIDQLKDYDLRKQHTEKFAHNLLKTNPIYMNNDRKHDIADALCIMYYYISQEKKKLNLKNKRKKTMLNLLSGPTSLAEMFSQFEYKG